METIVKTANIKTFLSFIPSPLGLGGYVPQTSSLSKFHISTFLFFEYHTILVTKVMGGGHFRLCSRLHWKLHSAALTLLSIDCRGKMMLRKKLGRHISRPSHWWVERRMRVMHEMVVVGQVRR